MKLTNPKTFEKWCEKNGFRAGAMLDGERVGLWDTSTPWTFGDNCDCAGTVSEAIYRFIG